MELNKEIVLGVEIELSDILNKINNSKSDEGGVFKMFAGLGARAKKAVF